MVPTTDSTFTILSLTTGDTTKLVKYVLGEWWFNIVSATEAIHSKGLFWYIQIMLENRHNIILSIYIILVINNSHWQTKPELCEPVLPEYLIRMWRRIQNRNTQLLKRIHLSLHLYQQKLRLTFDQKHGTSLELYHIDGSLLLHQTMFSSMAGGRHAVMRTSSSRSHPLSTEYYLPNEY